MYQVELSPQARADLDDFSLDEIKEIFSLLFPLANDPKPPGVQAIPFPEAADGVAYLYDLDSCSVFYNIFETARVVKIVAIFKKISLN
jgi:hypothetical protein